MIRLGGQRHRARVRALLSGRVRFERGSVEGLGEPERVAVLAQWSATARMSRSFVTLARELDDAGYRLVVVSACERGGELDPHGSLPAESIIIRKPNVGYDFGSWSVALAELPALARADRVILANDSMIGPFATLKPIVGSFHDSAADVYGLTDTRQYFRHLQSYFLAFRGGILAEPPLARFFRDVRTERSKWDVIKRYELGLTRLLVREGYGFSVAFRADSVVPAGENPVIKGWWRLLEQGFPFVKREIVRNPKVAPRAERVAREIEASFGARLEDWV